MAWPRADFYGTAVYQQYTAVIFVPAILLVGALYYFFFQRGRSLEVLPEHAAGFTSDGRASAKDTASVAVAPR
jgi:hypothetical protein